MDGQIKKKNLKETTRKSYPSITCTCVSGLTTFQRPLSASGPLVSLNNNPVSGTAAVDLAPPTISSKCIRRGAHQSRNKISHLRAKPMVVIPWIIDCCCLAGDGEVLYNIKCIYHPSAIGIRINTWITQPASQPVGGPAAGGTFHWRLWRRWQRPRWWCV